MIFHISPTRLMVKKACEKDFHDPKGEILTFVVVQVMEVPELISDERVHYYFSCGLVILS